jgi:hypothetical protein
MRPLRKMNNDELTREQLKVLFSKIAPAASPQGSSPPGPTHQFGSRAVDVRHGRCRPVGPRLGRSAEQNSPCLMLCDRAIRKRTRAARPSGLAGLPIFEARSCDRAAVSLAMDFLGLRQNSRFVGRCPVLRRVDS